MRYAKLGKTGLEVSAITLGCMSFGEPGERGRPWTLDEAACRGIVRQALDAGINTFDTANVYSAGRSEEITGQALKDLVSRDEVVLATKVLTPTRSLTWKSPTSRTPSRASADDGVEGFR
jgi:1-deoxyxylulose-5-phosphate synthase